MAQIQPEPMAGKTKRKIPAALFIDMTPMVDLGFLLISFFIFTTTMAEKRATTLFMPKESTDSLDLPESKAITAILAKDDKVFVYAGKWEDAVRNNKIAQTSYNHYPGLGNFIRFRQKALRENKDGLMLLIKPLSNSSYKNLIDALDEALINNIPRYAIVEASAVEKTYVENAG